MNSEISVEYSPKTFQSRSLVTDRRNHHMLLHKTNPHKITKQSYENPPLSKKGAINAKRNTLSKREQYENSSLVMKNISPSDLDAYKSSLSLPSSDLGSQGQECQCDSRGKENYFLEYQTPAQNYKDAPNGSQYSKSLTIKPVEGHSEELVSTPQSEQENKPKRFNQFSTYKNLPDSQFVMSEEKRESRRITNTNLTKTTRHSSQENEFSDPESTGEIITYQGENHGSERKFPQDSLRIPNSFGVLTNTAIIWDSQENSCNSALDCEEALRYQNSVVIIEKNEDSLQDPSEFEQDFPLFSNNEAQDEIPSPQVLQKKEKEKTIEEELAEFNPEVNPCSFDSDTINYLIMREIDYAPELNYMERYHSQINWSMRAILFDWMMEVCMEFGLKRETYHYSINYVDRYLSTVRNVDKKELQLIGVSALYMASKVEEIYPPRVSSFARSTDSAYSTTDITSMEMKILKVLKWLLTPPTLNTWANWYMNQWDLYVEHSEYAKNHLLVHSNKIELMQFKQSNQISYAKFREMMQIIDCVVLDIQTLQYKPRALIASVMYMLLGKYFKQFSNNQMFEQFPRNSSYLLDKTNQFNDLFDKFLLYSFGFELSDLLPSVQYVSTFIKLPINLDLPKAVKMTKEKVLEGHFEEFLAYQTHNVNNIQYIRKRPRNHL